MPDLLPILKKWNRAVRDLNLGQLYMAVTLLRIRHRTMIVTSAGMPATLVYRKATRTVEHIGLRGMPLGSVEDFPYQQEERGLANGDTVLLMSDGFPEMFNDRRETLDYEKAAECFREVAEGSPQEIIRGLEAAAHGWANGFPQQDDMTFVVLQVREQDGSRGRNC
jgi:serine phosphatase RsbU (regulator of sigma subunit)